MPRKMIVVQGDGSTSTVLTEVPADNEAQLQERMKNTPDLLPVDEFDMTGPLLVVGRETRLPSGAADLLALARSGELLIIEFKTGPQNSDFRHVLAQLLDYGSDLWQMPFDQFETDVVRTYFEGSHCQDPLVKGKRSLEEAAIAVWPDLSPEERIRFRERLVEQLRTGAFHYVVVAQSFLPTMERTVAYMNATMSGARFYAVELVRFAASNVSAFEARTLLKPTPEGVSTPRALLNETQFLERVADASHRDVLRTLLEHCRNLGLRFEWGTAGVSIRVRTPDRTEPVTIGWLFPPGVSGWMGLADLTLGFDRTSGAKVPSARPALEDYAQSVAALPGAKATKQEWLQAHQFDAATMQAHWQSIVKLITTLVEQVNGVT